MGKIMTAPCKNCNKRDIHCHGKCNEYSNYKSELEKINKMKKAKNEAHIYTTSSYRERVTKIIRRQK